MDEKSKEYIRIDYYKNPNNEIIVSNIRMYNKRIILQKMKSGNIKMIIANACKDPNKPIVSQGIIHSIVRYTEQQFSPDVMLAISNCYMIMSGYVKPDEGIYEMESEVEKKEVKCDICGHMWKAELTYNQISSTCPNCKQIAYFDAK